MTHKICITFRKYDGRGKIYIERDDSTGHWQVKPRSWLKTGTFRYGAILPGSITRPPQYVDVLAALNFKFLVPVLGLLVFISWFLNEGQG